MCDPGYSEELWVRICDNVIPYPECVYELLEHVARRVPWVLEEGMQLCVSSIYYERD